ncbi:FGGY-family carbohydrate kinase [candidate division KSB1 bacterium]|nr:FGGY-family carbohydrate kinase [candidate division KSB1 bacterium]
MEETILAIDNGTQSIRAMLFNARGELLSKSQVHIEPYFSIQAGWAEQEPGYFWDKLALACQKLWQQSGNMKSTVKAVCLTTQRSTLINVDKNGQALRPAIHWLDQRRVEKRRVTNPLLHAIIKLIRMGDTVAFAFAECESNWLRENQPDIWEKTHKYLFLSGYLTWQLTGNFVDSIGCQVGYVPFDYKNLRWAKSGHLNRKLFPMEMDKLPELVPQGQVLGVITKQANQKTGIPEGLPLIAAAADKACEILGAGSLNPETACLSYGTTCTTSIMTRKYVEVIPMISPFPSAIPQTYNTEIQIYRGYWLVSWFKNEFGHAEQNQAAELNVPVESLFDDMIKDVPPGSMGLMLQPYWTPGVKVPGPEAKGAIIGFGDVHTRAHMYRSILEGLTFSLREGTEKTERRSGIPITSLRVSGGGSQSDQAMQITADIFNKPASRPHIYETSGLGAAIDAAVGIGWFSDFPAAVSAMTRIGRTFEPNHKNTDIYEQLYQRIYKKMYGRLQQLYHDIKDITGYPER